MTNNNFNEEFNNDFEGQYNFGLPGHIENMYTDLKILIDNIQQVIAENYDNRKKEVGDRVVVWDGSSLSGYEGEEVYIIEPPFTETDYFVVVETEQDSALVFSFSYSDDEEIDFEEDEDDEIEFEMDEDLEASEFGYIQDLVIADPATKRKFRVSSEHVRRID